MHRWVCCMLYASEEIVLVVEDDIYMIVMGISR